MKKRCSNRRKITPCSQMDNSIIYQRIEIGKFFPYEAKNQQDDISPTFLYKANFELLSMH